MLRNKSSSDSLNDDIVFFCCLTLIAVVIFLPCNNILGQTRNTLTNSYQNSTLGIDFHYPSNWKVSTSGCKLAGPAQCIERLFIIPINKRADNYSLQLELVLPKTIEGGGDQYPTLNETFSKIINDLSKKEVALTLIDSRPLTYSRYNADIGKVVHSGHVVGTDVPGTWYIEYVYNPLVCTGQGNEGQCHYHHEPGSPYYHVITFLIEPQHKAPTGKIYELDYSAIIPQDLAFYKNLHIVRDIIHSFYGVPD
jgi:hypothetical protein